MSTVGEDIGHREAWELIPWLVNGRAEASDREKVEQHLAHCAACRDELAFQGQLQAALAQEAAVADDPQPGLQRLWNRIDAIEEPPQRRQWHVRPWQQILVAAVLVEAIGIAALSSVVWSHDARQAPYRTLTTPDASAAGATLRVVLAPTLAVADLQGLLARTHLKIVGGPSAAGVYSLAPVTAPGAANTLAQLRADPGVRFAEPVGSSADDTLP